LSDKNNLDKHLLDQIESSNDFFWLRTRHRLVLTISKKLGIKNLLDIGAGVGGLGVEVSKDNINYYFSEPDRNSNQFLVEKFGKDKEISLNENLNINFKETSALIFLDVFEHIKDPKQLFNEYSKILKSGDYLIFTVPAYQFLWSSWDIHLGHFRRYNKKTCKEFVKTLNLEIIEISYLFPELLFPALIRKIRNRKKINFPKLPKIINNIFFRVSLFISGLRHLLPFGLSVLVIAKKN
jgi:SAM-dependent methyltransferase